MADFNTTHLQAAAAHGVHNGGVVDHLVRDPGAHRPEEEVAMSGRSANRKRKKKKHMRRRIAFGSGWQADG